MDDVLSELDSKRQEHLLSGISHIQTLITCTGLDDLVNSKFEMDKIFKIVEGNVVSEELSHRRMIHQTENKGGTS